MKKSNESINPVSVFWFCVIVVVLVWFFIFEPYCVKHHDEWEKERFDNFMEWHNEIMAGNTGINWDAKD